MKRKGLAITCLVAGLSVLTSMTAFAGEWKQDATGWWWQNDDGSYPVSTWKWLDGNKDGLSESYYFNEAGYLVTNTTIDGYTVNADGAWTINGEVLLRPGIVLFADRPVEDLPIEGSGEATGQSTGTMTSQEQFFSDLQDKYVAEIEAILSDPEVIKKMEELRSGGGGTAIGVR